MGGGAIRAAAKVAGMTAAGGLRSISAEHFPASVSARWAVSARTAASTPEEVKLVASSNSGVGMQRPCSEMDDWVFAGVEEEQMAAAAADPIPRLVFAGVPTIQEAKEATSELSVALEKAYLSPPSSIGYEGSIIGDGDSSLSVSDKQIIESSGSVSNAVPATAIMAFRLLHESPMAKNVVASIACDPNVWNAVRQNQELQGFLQSQGASLVFSDENSYTELAEDSEPIDHSTPKSVDSSSSENGEAGPANVFTNVFQKIKNSVVDMMSSLSDYFQSFFGGKGGNGVTLNSDGTANFSAETVMQGSFMGLAIMAILVILLKRA
ncbi:hypothetical protein ABFX02_08G179000 [Erythranthe guttata]